MAVKAREKPKAVPRVGPVQPSLFLTIILLNPVEVVQTVSLIFSFGWMNAIALLVIIVGRWVIEVILIHIHDCQRWKKILGYFCDFDGCFFEPTTIKLEQDLIKIRDVFRFSPQKSYFLSHFAMPSIQAFYVHPTGPTLPLRPVAYQMAGGTSYVFLAQRPEKMGFFCEILLSS